ncbi:MAG: NusG domain II-containing protein [Thermoanaerobacteraceae bacterium]|nr:NusG domain II-containing protein [Thermoanaerobacteraceae bacterium]
MLVMLMTKYDKFLIYVIIVVSILGMGYDIYVATNATTGSIITVQIDNEVVEIVPLNFSGESKLYIYTFKKGQAAIETKDGKVRMLPMPRDICPEGICSDTGWIDKPYKNIVCLPNKIMVSINSVEKKNNIDDVAF